MSTGESREAPLAKAAREEKIRNAKAVIAESAKARRKPFEGGHVAGGYRRDNILNRTTLDHQYEVVQDAAIDFLSHGSCGNKDKRTTCSRAQRRVEYVVSEIFDKLSDLQFYRHIGRLWYELRVDVSPNTKFYI